MNNVKQLDLISSNILVNSSPPRLASELFKDKSIFSEGYPFISFGKITPYGKKSLAENFKITGRGATATEMAQQILSVESENIESLAQMLVIRQKTFVLPQIENLVHRFNAGESRIKLNNTGLANFFFVYSGASVFLLQLFKRPSGWDRFRNDFHHGSPKWGPENHLFSNNPAA